MTSVLRFVVAVALFAPVASGLAQVTPTEPATGPGDGTTEPGAERQRKSQPEPWFHQPPPSDDADWVQLKTGEWLRGDLLGMHEREIEFDSDRVKEQTIKLKYVRRLYMRAPVTVTTANLSTLHGPGQLVADRLTIQTSQGPQTASRSELLTIVPHADNELETWHLDASLGLNAARGNVNQTVFNASTDVEREDEWTRLTGTYLVNYGESRDRMIAHNHRVSGRIDVYLSEAFFLTPALVIAEMDEFKNLSTRASAVTGVGIRALDQRDIRWHLALLGGYHLIRYDSVTEGTDRTRNNVAVSAGTELDVDVTDDVDFNAQYIIHLIATDVGLTTHRASAKLEVDLTELFDLELRVVYDRTEQPVADEDGQVPERDDLSLIVAFGIDIN